MNKKITQILLSLSFCAGSLFSQQSQELNTKLQTMQQSADASVKAEAEYLSGLVNDLKPSLYFQDGKMSTTQETAPVRVYSDIASIGLLKSANTLFNQVQLICIKIQKPEDLQSVINASDFSQFTSLKYVYFLCTFNICTEGASQNTCENEKISKVFQGGANSSINVIYNISAAE